MITENVGFNVVKLWFACEIVSNISGGENSFLWEAVRPCVFLLTLLCRSVSITHIRGLAPGRRQSSPVTGFSVHGIVAVPILWRTL